MRAGGRPQAPMNVPPRDARGTRWYNPPMSQASQTDVVAMRVGGVVIDPSSQVPMIGASGAISGVLGAYLLLFPHARVHVLIWFGLVWLRTVPAGWLLGFWFLFQLLSGLWSGPAQGGVAFWAHIGGFVAGMALILVFRDRRYKVGGGRARLPGRSRIPRTRSGPWS